MNNLIKQVSLKTGLQDQYIKNILALLEEGATIPFIARYRKEKTGNATDEKLREFEEVYNYFYKLSSRKEEIISILKERDFLNDKLLLNINEAATLTVLEDIYAPYKLKKSSRATIAIENGLEGLANIIQCCKYSIDEVKHKAKSFLNTDYKSIDEVLNGAKDIIAQRYADDFKSKEVVRRIIQNYATLETKATKTFEENGLYKNFKEVNEKIKYIKSYRFLAINRAVNEKQLTMKINCDEKSILENIKKYKIHDNSNSSKELLFEAYKDGFKRILLPSLKREALSLLKDNASKESITVFGKNLSSLLMTPPVVNKIILGMDPGYKSGCKLAVINEDGKYLGSSVIYPTKPKEDFKGSSKTVLGLIKKYKINTIAIGNGTASNETASFISTLIKENSLNIKYAVVSEIGASVYSASKIAQEEYPNLDVTIRGAISIAQRLRDPMAALVKIDPKSLGIGQYQHDVNQSELSKKLQDVTVDLVNKVGVDVKSSSFTLLSYISGVSATLAKNIVLYREANSIKSKNDLKKVKGMGAKSFEQSVGFLRIKDGTSLLDNTAVHPENYEVAKTLLKDFDIQTICENETKELCSKFSIGSETLKDIIDELKKPGFDIREELEDVKFADDIKDINDLKEGYIVSGIVRNITDFGAFVDIGLKNDALIHISQISDKRISHPMEVLSVNEQLSKIKVIQIDIDKQRVGLSLKQLS